MNEPSEHDPAAELLARFRPAQPRPELMQRLLALQPASLPQPVAPARPVLVRFLTSRAFSMAAAVACAVAAFKLLVPEPAIQPQQQTTGAGANTVTRGAPPPPLQSNQQLLGVRNLGIARDAQSRPVRLMHATWLDDNVYTGENGRSPVREATVREEIVPVVLTTY